MYNKLYESLLRSKKEFKDANNKIELLSNQIELIEKENSALNILVQKLLIENNMCNQCEIYKVKINDLTKALQGFTNSKHRLENILKTQ